jgi:hypothetical protein
MPKICYTPKKFRPETLQMIADANTIIAEYEKAGFKLTLRQIYYQFVSRDLIPNTKESYKSLGEVVNNARLAGLIDWDAIEDRTRNLRSLAHWDSPKDIVKSCAYQFRVDRWANQPNYCEVWIEKDALSGIIQGVCNENDVPFFACRGYTSQSEMWGAAMRLIQHENDGKDVTIIHLGDHDPSGIDMTRDIQDRLELFGCGANVLRIALNWDQVEAYKPPPNFAKTTDCRYKGYEAKYGDESWELDALDPTTIESLVRKHIDDLLDKKKWKESNERQQLGRGHLHAIHDQWDRVCSYLDEKYDDD